MHHKLVLGHYLILLNNQKLKVKNFARELSNIFKKYVKNIMKMKMSLEPVTSP